MKAWIRALAGLALLAFPGFVLSPGEARAAAQIRTQPPCTTGGDNCFNFGVGSAGVNATIIRSFSYTAPSAGTANVSFTGTILCASSAGSGIRVVDLVTQIVSSPPTVPDIRGAGALRQAVVLQPRTSETINLASSRVFTLSRAGTQTYHFSFHPRRIDADTNCFIYDAAFTVIFVP